MLVSVPLTGAYAIFLSVSVFGVEFDYTLRNVVLGSAMLGLVGGVIGAFAVLRRQSLLSDALAHAALPGICVAFILAGTKTTLGFLIGAAISGWIGTMVLLAIVRGSRIKEDAALGIVLSVFFGFGAVLLTRIARGGNADQSGLNTFLFGQAASIIRSDVILLTGIGAGVLFAVALLFKEFKLLSFDPDYMASLGYPTLPITIGLTTLIVIAVVIGLQLVGVVLMVTVLVAPALAARQWTNHLGRMVPLSGALGVIAGVAGSVVSSEVPRLPTGPTIVLVATAMVVLSLLVAPERGILWGEIARWTEARRISDAATLRRIADQNQAVPALARMSHPFRPSPNRSIGRLKRRGLIQREANGLVLTEAGQAQADQFAYRERIWKTALAHLMDLPIDAVHLRMDDIERILSPEVRAQLERLAQGDIDAPPGVPQSGVVTAPRGAD